MVQEISDTRYPDTYACDLIRNVAGYREDGRGIKLSRADACQIRKLFSDILNISNEELAKKLANHFLLHEKELTAKAAKEFLQTLQGSDSNDEV